MTGQNLPSKFCYPLDFFTKLRKIEKGVRSFNAEKLGFVDQRPQSYQLSNFENDSTLGVLEPGPNVLAQTSVGMAEPADFLLRTQTFNS